MTYFSEHDPSAPMVTNMVVV